MTDRGPSDAIELFVAACRLLGAPLSKAERALAWQRLQTSRSARAGAPAWTEALVPRRPSPAPDAGAPHVRPNETAPRTPASSDGLTRERLSRRSPCSQVPRGYRRGRSDGRRPRRPGYAALVRT